MKDGSWQDRSRWGVVSTVVVVHLAALWWLQSGLSHEAWTRVMPVDLISVMRDEPAPVRPAPVPPAAVKPQPVRPEPPKATAQPVPRTPVSPSAPLSTAPEMTSPASAAVLASSAGPGPALAGEAVPAGQARAATSSAPSGGGGQAAAAVLPSSQAAYLHNPVPVYPAISRRLGEQGRVLVRVLIGVDGTPQKAEVQSGSGYDRLDRVALQTVMGWRFVPGRRGDTPEAMWVSVPIQFQME
jgi:protein TonB